MVIHDHGRVPLSPALPPPSSYDELAVLVVQLQGMLAAANERIAGAGGPAGPESG